MGPYLGMKISKRPYYKSQAKLFQTISAFLSQYGPDKSIGRFEILWMLHFYEVWNFNIAVYMAYVLYAYVSLESRVRSYLTVKY